MVAADLGGGLLICISSSRVKCVGDYKSRNPSRGVRMACLMGCLLFPSHQNGGDTLPRNITVRPATPCWREGRWRCLICFIFDGQRYKILSGMCTCCTMYNEGESTICNSQRKEHILMMTYTALFLKLSFMRVKWVLGLSECDINKATDGMLFCDPCCVLLCWAVF